jgi:hypothetical protein
MEPHPQNGQKTLAKAHRQATAAHLDKGVHRLEKGITRFAIHNGRLLTSVALGAGALFAMGRWARRSPTRASLLSGIRTRDSNGSNVAAFSAMLGAAALIGAGVTLLLAPHWVLRSTGAQNFLGHAH